MIELSRHRAIDEQAKRKEQMRLADCLSALMARGHSAAEACEILAERQHRPAARPSPTPAPPATTTAPESGPKPFSAVAPSAFSKLAPRARVLAERQAGHQVKIYPPVALASIQRREHQGAALWHLARSFDVKGAGLVLLDELRAKALAAGMSSHQFKRALGNARRAGLLTVGKRRRESGTICARVVVLAGLQAVAEHYGLETLGPRPVLVPVEDVLRPPRFKAGALVAFHAAREGERAKPITRRKLAEITGIAERTQRTYERRAFATAHRNYVQSDSLFKNRRQAQAVADHLKRSGTRSGTFIIFDRRAKAWRLLWCAPNTYSTTYLQANRGSTRNTSRALRGALTLSAVGQRPRRAGRVFWKTQKDAEQVKAKQAPALIAAGVRERFYRARACASGAGLWRRVAVLTLAGVAD